MTEPQPESSASAIRQGDVSADSYHPLPIDPSRPPGITRPEPPIIYPPPPGEEPPPQEPPPSEPEPSSSYAVFYFHTDLVGSIRAVTDSQGQVVARYEYEPFGLTVKAEGPLAGHDVHKFTGKPEDAATGLYYFNARYYDPEVGRFTTQDPLGDGPNLYVYCYQNPLRHVDPSGLRPLDNPGGSHNDPETDDDLDLSTDYMQDALHEHDEESGGDLPPLAYSYGLNLSLSAGYSLSQVWRPVGGSGEFGLQLILNPNAHCVSVYWYYGAGPYYGTTFMTTLSVGLVVVSDLKLAEDYTGVSYDTGPFFAVGKGGISIEGFTAPEPGADGYCPHGVSVGWNPGGGAGWLVHVQRYFHVTSWSFDVIRAFFLGRTRPASYYVPSHWPRSGRP